MGFRNYCLIAMGITKGIVAEVTSIAEVGPNVLDAKGVAILTFSSLAEPQELTEFFKSKKRDFLLFDLNRNNSGFYFNKDNINDSLFGFLREMNEDNLKKKTDDLIKEVIAPATKGGEINYNITIDDLNDLNKDEKKDLLNFLLLEKGTENLTDEDKKMIDKLVIG